MKKKAELTFTPVVYAILALIILAVCITIFFLLTNTPFKNIFNIENNVTNSNPIDDVSALINKCNPGDSNKCISNHLYRCNSEKRWEKTEDGC
jgi:hypothetical protein